MRSTFRHVPAALAAVLATLACDGDQATTPPPAGDAQLQLVSGHQREDTVFAAPGDSLIVRITATGRGGIAGVPVRFRAPGERFKPHMRLIREGREFEVIEDTTDAGGRAAVEVAFGGPRPGYAWIHVEAPELELADSAFYVVLPGAPVQPAHSIFPFAPTVVVGDETTVWAVQRDAYGNDVLVTPTACTSDSPVVEVLPGCRLRGLAFGNAPVRLEHDDFVRPFTLGVLPPGTLAGPVGNEVLVVDLDGTVHHRLPAAQQVDWAPGGDRLVGLREGGFQHPGHIHLLELTGETRELIPEFAGSLGEEAPQYSADGQWVYFSAWRTGDRAELWRVPAEGGTPERLLASATPGERHRFPSPAPDGGALVYAHESADGASTLRVVDFGMGQVRSLGVTGTFPRWSPNGEWIAFAHPTGGSPSHRIALVRPDGADLRVLGPGDRMDWSPDGRYLAAGGGIISVETGELVRFGTFPATGVSHGGFGFSGPPAWRP